MEKQTTYSLFEEKLNIERNCGMDVEQTLKQLTPYLEQRKEVCRTYVKETETDEKKLKLLKDIINYYDDCILKILNIKVL
jgi:hypothetical protein